jgi:molybdate transport system substrate-binding protein
MNRTVAVMLGSILVVAGMFFMLARSDSRAGDSDESIMFFCAASNRGVIEAIRAEYENEFERSVQIQYGPSLTLLSSIEISKSGELYLPADDSFLKRAREKNLITETLPIARMQGVVAVKKGNPKAIRNFDDLLRSDVRVVQAGEAAAIGQITRQVLTDAGLWTKLDEATTAYLTTVTDVANDIVLGAADAGIVYDAVLHTYPDLEYIELPELRDAVSQVSVGVIANTKLPASALHFARYLAARDRGLQQYKAHGFRVSPGDKWDDVPELVLYAGSMLRPAIDDSITEFEKREGVLVSRTYNGCGLLVAQMKGGARPDAFFACDTEFMTQVKKWFPNPIAVSQNELVILVKKGNPKNIRSLRDLGREGLRVGVGHEKQCAMGWLTQNTFREAGLEKTIMPNVAVQSSTGDLLVNQMRAGSLDAAVAYLTNAAGSGEILDAIRIEGLDCSLANQPWAVADESDYPELSKRLFDKLTSVDAKEDFLAEGFLWQVDASEAGTVSAGGVNAGNNE